MTMRGWRARSSSAARSPRCDEPLSTIQNTRRAERYGSWLITWSTEGCLAGLWLTATKDHRPMDIPRGEVLQGSLPLVFVFDARRLVRAGRQRGMKSATRLDAGFLIGAEHILIRPQRLALPLAGVQLEHWASAFQEVRIAWKDPALVAPRAQRVAHQ